MKKTLHFSIEGEWLTEVARQKYWYEEEPYDKVFAWLKNCLCPCDGSETEAFSEQVDRIVDGILKGELKLTGVNQFEVEEDNAQEEYNAKIRKTEEDLRKMRFREDMRLFPEKYVDWYCTNRGMFAWETFDWAREHYQNSDGTLDWFKYFVRDDNPPGGKFFYRYSAYDFSDDYFLAGCYTLQNDFAGKLLNWEIIKTEEDKKGYAKLLDEYWERQIRFYKDDEEELRKIRRRTGMMSAVDKYLKANQDSNLEHWADDIKTPSKKAMEEISKESERPDYIDIANGAVERNKQEDYSERNKKKQVTKIYVWDGGEHHNWDFDWQCEDTYHDWAMPNEEILSEYGLISPSGDYYACTFASHESLAEHIVQRDDCLRTGFNNKYKETHRWDRSMEYLYELGWISCRNPYHGACYVDLGKYNNEDELPQKMLDTVYDWKIKFSRKR